MDKQPYKITPHDCPKGTNSLTKLLLTTAQNGQTALQNYSSQLPKRDKQTYKITPHDCPKGTTDTTSRLTGFLPLVVALQKGTAMNYTARERPVCYSSDAACLQRVDPSPSIITCWTRTAISCWTDTHRLSPLDQHTLAWRPRAFSTGHPVPLTVCPSGPRRLWSISDHYNSLGDLTV